MYMHITIVFKHIFSIPKPNFMCIIGIERGIQVYINGPGHTNKIAASHIRILSYMDCLLMTKLNAVDET